MNTTNQQHEDETVTFIQAMGERIGQQLDIAADDDGRYVADFPDRLSQLSKLTDAQLATMAKQFGFDDASIGNQDCKRIEQIAEDAGCTTDEIFSLIATAAMQYRIAFEAAKIAQNRDDLQKQVKLIERSNNATKAESARLLAELKAQREILEEAADAKLLDARTRLHECSTCEDIIVSHPWAYGDNRKHLLAVKKSALRSYHRQLSDSHESPKIHARAEERIEDLCVEIAAIEAGKPLPGEQFPTDASELLNQQVSADAPDDGNNDQATEQ